MKEFNIPQRLLVALCGCAMAVLFFWQATLVIRPVPIAFHPPEIAFGYSNVTFTGTVYTDEGLTNIGSNKVVALAINGTAAGTGATNTSGVYSIGSLTINSNDVITVYIDGATEKGAMVAKLDDTELANSPVTGMDIYQNRLIIRSDASDLNVTSQNLTVADNVNDSDLNAIFTITGSVMTMGPDTEFHLWQGTTFTASGAIYAHDVHNVGTMNIGSQTLFASGSLISTGSLITSGNIILQARSSAETLTVTGSSLNNLYFDNGLLAYFRFDEGAGTNASGSTLSSQTGGTLTGDATWGVPGTGSTVFFNPSALVLDGNGDYVSFNDSYDIGSRATRTFAGWFRRDTSTTDDVLLAKRAGITSADAGYALYLDNSDDKLHFEVSDNTDEYNIASTTTFTDTDWHHFAVTWDALSASGAQLYVGGALETVTRTGTFSDIGSIENAENFTIGADSSATNPYDGSLDDIRIYSRVLTGSEISFLADGHKDTGSGTYTLGSRLDVNGNFGIYAGRLDVNESKNYKLFLAKDVTAYGTLLTQSGTVALDGTGQLLRGSTAFRNFAKTPSSAYTLTFESNVQQVVSGSLVMNGTVGNLLSLRASVSGRETYLTLDDAGTQTLKYLNVQDNDAMSGSVLICTEGCIDNENNNNWQFLGICGDGVKNTGEACDDGNTSNGDSCTNTCALNVCGDGFVNTAAEECEPPGVGSCLNNCFFRGAGGGGGSQASAASTASYYKKPAPPEGCGNAIYEPEKGEECDLGSRFNGLGTCAYDCKKLYCGDGEISPQIGEDCEPQQAGMVNGKMTFTVGTCGEICTAPQQTAVLSTIVGGCKRVFLRACDSGSSSESGGNQATSVCGNGIREDSEECDYGGSCVGGQFDGSFWTDAESAQTCIDAGGIPRTQSGDGCDEQCQNEFCGDGIVQERGKDNAFGNEDDESCDNGSYCENDPSRSCRTNVDCGNNVTCVYNERANTKCSNSCHLSVCGNGQKESGETCDDGNAQGGDGCSSSCRTEIVKRPVVCGDGLREDTEECDDGNTSDGDGCSAVCVKQPLCGNGKTEAGEECDSGDANSNNNPDTCRTSCVKARCGDGVQDKGEECDAGQQNSDTNPGACRASCKAPKCGDGVIDFDEICDGGENCTSQCVPDSVYVPACGNGQRDTGEACDDGNARSGDGCDANCAVEIFAVCGNGTLEGTEQCDDGNSDDGDGCSKLCILEVAEKPAAPEIPVALEETLDADVIVVNPTEIANALKFVDNTNPCAIMVRKGVDGDADEIRRLAGIKGIPIVKRIPLAHTLFDTIAVGESVSGLLCEQVNRLKAGETEEPLPEPKKTVTTQPTPTRPTTMAYGFYNYASLQPIATSHPAAGETGPGALAAVISGAAGGMAWVRKKRPRKGKSADVAAPTN